MVSNGVGSYETQSCSQNSSVDDLAAQFGGESLRLCDVFDDPQLLDDPETWDEAGVSQEISVYDDRLRCGALGVTQDVAVLVMKVGHGTTAGRGWDYPA